MSIEQTYRTIANVFGKKRMGVTYGSCMIDRRTTQLVSGNGNERWSLSVNGNATCDNRYRGGLTYQDANFTHIFLFRNNGFGPLNGKCRAENMAFLRCLNVEGAQPTGTYDVAKAVQDKLGVPVFILLSKGGWEAAVPVEALEALGYTDKQEDPRKELLRKVVQAYTGETEMTDRQHDALYDEGVELDMADDKGSAPKPEPNASIHDDAPIVHVEPTLPTYTPDATVPIDNPNVPETHPNF